MAGKAKKIRWSLSGAASEFDIDDKALKRRLRTADEKEGADGKWSTRQITRAVFGDLAGERLRKTKEEADQVALKNAKIRGDLIELSWVQSAWEVIILNAKERFLLVRAKFESQYRVGMEADRACQIIDEAIEEALSELAKPPRYGESDRRGSTGNGSG